MTERYDVIIIGGSIAGLSAALILGRALRKVLIIDDHDPCFTPSIRTHGFITNDGENPSQIVAEAKVEVCKYTSIEWYSGSVISAEKKKNEFTIRLEEGKSFQSLKLLLATGVKDKLLPIPGFAECWGKSILHCPYCQGYEIRNQNIGFIGNGDYAIERISLLKGWTKRITLFTNGLCSLSTVQLDFLNERNIPVIENEIVSIYHSNGLVDYLKLNNGKSYTLSAIFTKVDLYPMPLPFELGCKLNDSKYIEIDEHGQTSITGTYAAGDCTTSFRTIPTASAAGLKAGIALNQELILEYF
ncbi:MAG: NAD(P)/FAD-dependent oxidoreductase [Ginsengibacter sp.]